MFFKAHHEGRIGYKEITKVELGVKEIKKGNLSHIGLFQDILKFLPDKNFEDVGMLIYNNKCESLGYSFDRIDYKNSGIYRSAKIRKGGKDVVSVVTVIQETAKDTALNTRWFLIWFGLESKEVVFYLFDENSLDYQKVSQIIDLSKPMVKGRVISPDSRFSALVAYLEDIVNKNNIENIKELEIVSQTGDSKKYRRFDIDEANKRFKKTGRLGEELVAQYLESLKQKGQIFNYSWVNEKDESSFPYDFRIQENNQNIVYIDVKSTLYEFERPMFFSGQEIEHITQNLNYNIFRVFNLETSKPLLRICDNSKDFASAIKSKTTDFQDNLQKINVLLKSVQFQFNPTIQQLKFKPEINL